MWKYNLKHQWNTFASAKYGLVPSLVKYKINFCGFVGCTFHGFHIKTNIDWIGAYEVQKFDKVKLKLGIPNILVPKQIHPFGLNKWSRWFSFCDRYNIYFCGFVFCELLNLVIVAGIYYFFFPSMIVNRYLLVKGIY